MHRPGVELATSGPQVRRPTTTLSVTETVATTILISLPFISTFPAECMAHPKPDVRALGGSKLYTVLFFAFC